MSRPVITAAAPEGAMAKHVGTVVHVTIEDRPEGGINVWSASLPGLILAGSPAKVAGMIVPAITALLQHRGVSVLSVVPFKPIEEVLADPSPRDVAIEVHHAYAVEIELPEAA
jgi:hypothetical protein